jgi:hypothetical protein
MLWHFGNTDDVLLLAQAPQGTKLNLICFFKEGIQLPYLLVKFACDFNQWTFNLSQFETRHLIEIYNMDSGPK